MVNSDFLIVALDFPDAESALTIVDNLGEQATFYKVGMELFFADGNTVIRHLQNRGKKIFLDLKLRDIPATLERSVRVIANKYKPDFLTVFALEDGVKAAVTGSNGKMKILNVTVLTSEVRNNVAEIVKQKAILTQKAGGDGVVCSGLETKMLREFLPPDFTIVNPGIRLIGNPANDQKRIVTPKQALLAGASHIVVGRPITRSENPKEVFESILASLSES